MRSWSAPKHLLRTVMALALAVPMFACDDDDDDFIGPDGGGEDTARLRAVHASPDAPPIDIYVAGDMTPIIEDLEYGEASQYVPVPLGGVELAIRDASEDPDTDPLFTTSVIDVMQGEQVTAVAAGFVGGSGDQAFRVIALDENFQSPGAGEAVVRVVHASPDAPPVSIDVGDDGEVELVDVGRFEATTSEGVIVPAGEPIQVGILTGDPPERATAFTVQLPEGAEVFVIATGRLTDRLPSQPDAFALLAVDQQGALDLVRQNPVLFALHGSPDAPPVDVFLGDTKAISDLAFSELSGPVQVPPGRFDLDFFPAGEGPEGSPVATASTGDLEAGELYLEVASGYLTPVGEQPSFRLLRAPENFALDVTDEAQFALIHASPDTPAIDASTVGDDGLLTTPILVEDLSFGEITDPIPVPAANLVLGVAPNQSRTPIVSVPVTTVAGQRTFAVAIGAIEPASGEEPLTLVGVETAVFPWEAAILTP